MNDLAVQSEIEAFALHLFGDAEPDHHIDDFEQDQTRPDRTKMITTAMNCGRWLIIWAAIANVFDHAGATEGGDREDAGEHSADDSADAMHAEASSASSAPSACFTVVTQAEHAGPTTPSTSRQGPKSPTQE